MFELTSPLGDLSTPVKVGWTIWVAWGIVALGWYRHARVAEHVAPAMSDRYTSDAPASRKGYEHDTNHGDSAGSSYDESAGSSGATH